MAASDRWTDDIVCQCGAAVTVHWVDRAYLTSEPEISRVVGPAIKRKHKSGAGISKDWIDVLCDRCGAVLHESEAAKRIDLGGRVTAA